MDETERQSEDRGWDTAKTLAEALPYIQIYDRKTVVIKYGGHAMGESAVAKQFAADVVLLKLMGVNPVVVHGGGPQATALSTRLGLASELVAGRRVTNDETLDVVKMVYRGLLSTELVSALHRHGVQAAGLSGFKR